MKKISAIAALCAVSGSLLGLPFSHAAAETSLNPYTQYIEPDTFAVSAEDAASGSVSIPIRVYVKGHVDDAMKVSACQIRLASDFDSYIYFRDIFSPTVEGTVENTYSYLNGEFTTMYTPFCFGKVTNGTYNIHSVSCETNQFCSNPVSGTSVYYEGNDTISFRLSGRYYVNEAGELAQDTVSHIITCPLTLHENGSATYTFKYANIFTDHVEVSEAVGTIPYYQPEQLTVGGIIPDFNNIICWVSDTIDHPTSFLGNSDDMPILCTDLHLKKDTPCGIYDITMDDEDCQIIAMNETTSILDLPLTSQKTSIIVGGEKAVLTTSMPEIICCYAESRKMITANSAGISVQANMTFTDGTSLQAQDVTGAVHANSTPAGLYGDSVTPGYYLGTLPMYCGDTPLLTEKDAAYQQNIGVGMKGDVNMDGKVDINDSAAVLEYYAASAAGNDASLTDGSDPNKETLAYFLGDINTGSQNHGADGGMLDINDSADILQYYASMAAGHVISWDTFL